MCLTITCSFLLAFVFFLLLESDSSINSLRLANAAVLQIVCANAKCWIDPDNTQEPPNMERTSVYENEQMKKKK